MRKCFETVAAALLAATLGAASARSQSLELPPDLRERPTPETPTLDTRGFDLSSLDLRGDVGEDRRTMGAFPKNLGRNFVGVWSGQNLFPFAVGLGSATLASAFDAGAKSMLKGACESCGRTGARVGGSAMIPVMATLFVAGRFSPQGQFRSATYDNWRLSTARAHMAYYMLVRGGIPEGRFDRVEGYADHSLRVPNDPEAAQNRRIEILVRKPK